MERAWKWNWNKKKKMTEQDFEGKVRETLRQECEGISASESLKRRIDEQINTRQEEKSMTRISIKKVAVGVAAACLLISGVTFAGYPSTWVSGSPSMPEYESYGEMGKAEEKLGYAVDYVESFGNGYTFAGASIDKSQALDESGNVLYEYDEMDIQYKKAGEGTISLICNNREGVPQKEPDVVKMCGNVQLAYDVYENHFITTDYVITERDKKLMEKENIIYSVGTDTNEVRTLQTLRWEKDGIYYELFGFDISLGADDMFTMAEEMINAQ